MLQRYWQVLSTFQLQVLQVLVGTHVMISCTVQTYWQVFRTFRLEGTGRYSSYVQLQVLQVLAGTQVIFSFKCSRGTTGRYSVLFSLKCSRYWPVLKQCSALSTQGTGRYSALFSFKYSRYRQVLSTISPLLLHRRFRHIILGNRVGSM